MREIKFRGKPLEDYGEVKWFFGSLISSNDDELAYIEADYQGTVPVEWDSVGQYTGLKDKNGKEIFEGDIVFQEFYDNRRLEVGGFTGVVKQSEGTWWIDNGENHAERLWSEVNVNEVIGNIYENPELLEEAQ